MGKRLSDLNLSDDKIGGDDLGRIRRDAETFADELQEMIDSDQYNFCWGFLADLLQTVKRSERVTDAQKDAVHNIKVGAQRHEDQREGWERHEKRTGRRYDGFDTRLK